MCGSATLAMAVSRSSINVAKVTTTAMNHGLMLMRGNETENGAAGASVSLMASATVRCNRDRSVSFRMCYGSLKGPVGRIGKSRFPRTAAAEGRSL
jgi:hypothetical protein